MSTPLLVAALQTVVLETGRDNARTAGIPIAGALRSDNDHLTVIYARSY